MTQPFPDMDFWGAFMAMGPIRWRTPSSRRYGRKPLSTGPYMIEEFRPSESLTLVKNPNWDPASDAARHQYADSWTFKFDQDREKVDQILMSDSAEGQTTVSNGLGAANVTKLEQALGDNFIQQTGQCVSYKNPDYNQITDMDVRKAIALLLRLRQHRAGRRSGPGRHPDPREHDHASRHVGPEGVLPGR